MKIALTVFENEMYTSFCLEEPKYEDFIKMINEAHEKIMGFSLPENQTKEKFKLWYKENNQEYTVAVLIHPKICQALLIKIDVEEDMNKISAVADALITKARKSAGLHFKCIPTLAECTANNGSNPQKIIKIGGDK